MNDKIITTSISLLLTGSVLALVFEPLSTFGYGYVAKSNYEYGYGYGTTTDTTTSSDTTTSTNSSDSNLTGDTLTDADHEVVVEVPSDSTTDQTTDQTTENDKACSVDKPNHLKVRHKKNKVILRWRGSDDTCPTANVVGYIVRIKNKRGKLVVKTNELEQLHYTVQRKKLKMNKAYTFAVRAILEAGEKTEWSKAKRFRNS